MNLQKLSKYVGLILVIPLLTVFGDNGLTKSPSSIRLESPALAHVPRTIRDLPEVPQNWERLDVGRFSLTLPLSEVEKVEKVGSYAVKVLGKAFYLTLHDFVTPNDSSERQGIERVRTFDDWVTIESTTPEDAAKQHLDETFASRLVAKAISNRGVSEVIIVACEKRKAIIRKHGAGVHDDASSVVSLQVFSTNGLPAFNANLIRVSDRFVLEFLSGIELEGGGIGGIGVSP